jgi:hypothetical protein
VSLVDKRTGSELVDPGAPQGFGQYFYERFGYQQLSDWIDRSLYPQYEAHKFAFVAYDMPQDVDYSSALPQDMSLYMEKSAIDVRAVLTGTLSGPGPPQEVSISLTLSGMKPCADIEVGWQKLPDSWPEAAWLCLPFRCDNPKFRLGRIGADVDPVEDMVTDNANYHMWWVNNGVALYDGNSGSGIAVCSPDAPVVSLGEPGEYQFDARYEADKPYLYINLYNNHWRTNFSAWIGNGQPMWARVRLWTFDDFSVEGSLYTPAMETRVPLQVASSKVRHGRLPVAQSGIVLSRKGVAVSAFGPNPDGAGYILRLWENTGSGGACTVALPQGLATASLQPVDLRGRLHGKPIQVEQGVFTAQLRPYAPVTYQFELP